MYRIKFYNGDGVLIATHTVVADKLYGTMDILDKYCISISKTYKSVTHWFIYEYSGRLLKSGSPS